MAYKSNEAYRRRVSLLSGVARASLARQAAVKYYRPNSSGGVARGERGAVCVADEAAAKWREIISGGTVQRAELVRKN